MMAYIRANASTGRLNSITTGESWTTMMPAGLPLLAHTGGEHTVPVIRKEFSNPRILRRPLEIGLTVIAAHCGTKSGLTDPDYFHVWADMLREFPNLYGDNSAFKVPIRGRHIPECLVRASGMDLNALSRLRGDIARLRTALVEAG